MAGCVFARWKMCLYDKAGVGETSIDFRFQQLQPFTDFQIPVFRYELAVDSRLRVGCQFSEFADTVDIVQVHPDKREVT